MNLNSYSTFYQLFRTFNIGLLLFISMLFVSSTQAQLPVVVTESFESAVFPPVTPGQGGGTWRTYRLQANTNVWFRDFTLTAPAGIAYATYNASGGSQSGAVLETPAIDWSERGTNQPTISFWAYRGIGLTSTVFTEGITIRVSSTQGSATPPYVNNPPGTQIGFIPRRIAQNATSSNGWTMAGMATVPSSGWYKYSFTMPVSGNGSFSGPVQYITFSRDHVGANDGSYPLDEVQWIAYPLASSLSEIQHSSINIFPNPASTTLQIESDQLISQFRIFDLLGREVYTGSTVSNKSLSLDISFLESGIYFIEIITPKIKTTRKIIKK